MEEFKSMESERQQKLDSLNKLISEKEQKLQSLENQGSPATAGKDELGEASKKIDYFEGEVRKLEAKLVE